MNKNYIKNYKPVNIYFSLTKLPNTFDVSWKAVIFITILFAALLAALALVLSIRLKQ